MNSIKTPVLVGATLLVALPVAWQETTLAALRRDLADGRAQEEALSAQVLVSENERAMLERALDHSRAVAAEAAARWAQAPARTAGPATTSAQSWQDGQAWARVPKDLVRKLRFTGLRNPQGELSEIIQGALQLTASEASEIQGALHRFLARYHDVLARSVTRVAPNDSEREVAGDGEIRVFEATGLREPVDRLRADLFSEIRQGLDDDRASIFIRSLGSWMPIEDREVGVSSGRMVYDADHRFWFGAHEDSDPASPSLRWGIEQAGRYRVNGMMSVADVPAWLHPHLRDWMELASLPRDQRPSKDAPAVPSGDVPNPAP